MESRNLGQDGALVSVTSTISKDGTAGARVEADNDLVAVFRRNV